MENKLNKGPKVENEAENEKRTIYTFQILPNTKILFRMKSGIATLEDFSITEDGRTQGKLTVSDMKKNKILFFDVKLFGCIESDQYLYVIGRQVSDRVSCGDDRKENGLEEWTGKRIHTTGIISVENLGEDTLSGALKEMIEKIERDGKLNPDYLDPPAESSVEMAGKKNILSLKSKSEKIQTSDYYERYGDLLSFDNKITSIIVKIIDLANAGKQVPLEIHDMINLFELCERYAYEKRFLNSLYQGSMRQCKSAKLKSGDEEYELSCVYCLTNNKLVEVKIKKLS